MASGNAIRGSRVGAGPMGEAERGEAAPRVTSPTGAPTGTRPGPSFAEERAWRPRDLGLPALRAPGRPGLGEPAGRRRRSSRTRRTWPT